tara:strand:- start:382 stop:711 length:330 start_codon:yes stop_codon:yes gene_type:complete
MSQTLLNAAMLKLKAEATTALGTIEVLLNNPVAISEHTDYVGEIVAQAQKLSEYEDAMKALQQYFGPPPAASPAPPQTIDPTAAVKVTPEMSPTYKASLEKQKIKESAE